MIKKFEGDFTFNNIEIDLEKNIYLIDGKQVERCTELTIIIRPFDVEVHQTKTLIARKE